MGGGALAKQLPHGRETRGFCPPPQHGWEYGGGLCAGRACVACAGACDCVGAGGASLSNVASLCPHCPPEALERGVTTPPKGSWESEQLYFPRQVGTTLSRLQFPLHLPRSPHTSPGRGGGEPGLAHGDLTHPCSSSSPNPLCWDQNPPPFLARAPETTAHTSTVPRPPPAGTAGWMQGPPLLTPPPTSRSAPHAAARGRPLPPNRSGPRLGSEAAVRRINSWQFRK